MSFENKIEIYRTEREKLIDRIYDYKTKIAILTQKGTSSGKWYIRKDKSLKTGEVIETRYIIYPMRDGKRRKEYVGRYSLEISKAQGRLDRYAKRAGFIESLNKFESNLELSDKAFNEAFRLLGSDNMMSVLLFSTNSCEIGEVVI